MAYTFSMPKATTSQTDIQRYTKQLDAYKTAIEDAINAYSKQIKKSTLQTFGKHSRIAVDAYLDILSRGGKRIRGALVMASYEMSGGKNKDMIIKAAMAVEMIHAYILMIDDINDRSPIRRSGPSAHTVLAEYYAKNEFGDDAQHFGESIAMDAALLGNHGAQILMANLDVDPQLRLNAISILNRGMNITIHGQFNDLFNQVLDTVSERDVDMVTEWKTAHYTFLNPIHIGMILAGADCHATDAITEYAMNTGKAFQLQDDILGTFGGEFEIGKSPLDDMREGKRTLLVVYALEHTSEANKNFLLQALGNHRITHPEFKRCKDIIISSGAMEYSQKKAVAYTQAAIDSLAKESARWSKSGVAFLRGLSLSLLNRTA